MLGLLLREATARINSQDDDGNTAFHLAVLEKHLDCAESFMENKEFDYTLKNEKGLTVGDLLDRQIQDVKDQVDLARGLKTRILRDYRATVSGILKEKVPVTHDLQKLAKGIVQKKKKLFISYCWDESYSTMPMVDDFEEFIKKQGIKEYYRDKRQEVGYGMTPGTNIEDFMRNATISDVVVIFF